mgnify:CR=1 FL=1
MFDRYLYTKETLKNYTYQKSSEEQREQIFSSRSSCLLKREDNSVMGLDEKIMSIDIGMVVLADFENLPTQDI